MRVRSCVQKPGDSQGHDPLVHPLDRLPRRTFWGCAANPSVWGSREEGGPPVTHWSQVRYPLGEGLFLPQAPATHPCELSAVPILSPRTPHGVGVCRLGRGATPPALCAPGDGLSAALCRLMSPLCLRAAGVTGRGLGEGPEAGEVSAGGRGSPRSSPISPGGSRCVPQQGQPQTRPVPGGGGEDGPPAAKP